MKGVFQRFSRRRAWTFGTVAFLVAAAFLATNRTPQTPKKFVESDAKPALYPDYSDVVLPLNIAPINFQIEEDAERFIASISSKNGTPIVLSGKRIDIPLNRWKRFTSANAGEEITIDIFAKKDGGWTKYRSIVNRISADPIDRFLYYRFIEPRFEFGNVLTLRQRDLESFAEKTFFSNESVGSGPCMNCHSFQNRQTERFLFHYRHFDRPELGGTFFVDGDKIEKIDARLPNGVAFAYPAWRPTGPFVAFSANKTRQLFHSLDSKKIEVFDLYSDLVLFNVATRETTQVTDTPNDFETFPSWSPDGKWLYYSSAKFDFNRQTSETDVETAATKIVREFQYNLMRIPFDERTATFGTSEKVIDAVAQGKSVVHPRISPDGKRLIYTLCDSGAFPIWHSESDLWELDLKTNQERPITEINSDRAETFHNWDSTGRWLIFSSRRDDGLRTRLYLTHTDAAGNWSKPFLLPQRDPELNRELLKSFNVPELTTEPINVDFRRFVGVAKNLPENLLK